MINKIICSICQAENEKERSFCWVCYEMLSKETSQNKSGEKWGASPSSPDKDYLIVAFILTIALVLSVCFYLTGLIKFAAGVLLVGFLLAARAFFGERIKKTEGLLIEVLMTVGLILGLIVFLSLITCGSAVVLAIIQKGV